MCVNTRYVAVHSTVDPAAAPLNFAVCIHEKGSPLHRRHVTRGWTELARRQFEDLDAVPASRCV